jgi:hypothetical protein
MRRATEGSIKQSIASGYSVEELENTNPKDGIDVILILAE